MGEIQSKVHCDALQYCIKRRLPDDVVSETDITLEELFDLGREKDGLITYLPSEPRMFKTTSKGIRAIRVFREKEEKEKPKKDWIKIIGLIIASAGFLYSIYSTERIYTKDIEINELKDTLTQERLSHKSFVDSIHSITSIKDSS